MTDNREASFAPDGNKTITIGGDTLHWFWGWSGCFNFRIDSSATTGQEDDSEWLHVCDADDFVTKLGLIAKERPQ